MVQIRFEFLEWETDLYSALCVIGDEPWEAKWWEHYKYYKTVILLLHFNEKKDGMDLGFVLV